MKWMLILLAVFPTAESVLPSAMVLDVYQTEQACNAARADAQAAARQIEWSNLRDHETQLTVERRLKPQAVISYCQAISADHAIEFASKLIR